MSDNHSFTPVQFRPTCTTPHPKPSNRTSPIWVRGVDASPNSSISHWRGELGGPFSPVREGEKKVICFWLTKWDMIQKPDMWLTEDWGRMNTTPSMKYLPKYFEMNVKGYSVASGSPINHYFEESVFDIWRNNAIQKFLRPHVVCTELSCIQFPLYTNRKDEACFQIDLYRAFLCVHV